MDSTTQQHEPAAVPAEASARTGGPFYVVLIGLGLVTIAALAAWAALRSGEAAPAGPLPVYADVPDFSLTERSGDTVTKADLRGTVWLADFVFTTCSGPCPVLTLRMRSIQQSLDHPADKVKLVSFSIDPERDRPDVLRRYAERFRADPDRWLFLTGDDEEQVHKLVKEGFLQAVSATGDQERYVHSTRFVLVDRHGRIRAWYDGMEAASKPLILRDIKRLLAEPAGP